MKKRILSLVIVLVMTLGLLPAISVANAATSGITGDCIWNLDGTVLTIFGNGKMQDYYYYGSSPWGNDITEVIIKNGVISIGDYAFSGSDRLVSISIPESLTSIGDYVFSSCYNLSEIHLDSIESWCNLNYYAPFSSTFRGSFYVGDSLITELVIPDSITSIGNGVFANCSSIKSVIIPDSVTLIDEYAFYNSNNIKSVEIKGGVETIGEKAFSSCYALTSITLPNTLKSIGKETFLNCYDLKSISIPDSVTSIGEGAFYSCESMESVTLGNGIKTIETRAFIQCYALTSITIPNSVTKINNEAFRSCVNLKTLTIPSSVTTIGTNAFISCKNISDIYYGGTQAQYSEIANAPYAKNMHYSLLKNESTGEAYSSVTEALSNAQSGETVALLDNTEITEMSINEGVTLDLNGYSLTASSIAGFNDSAVVDGSEDKTGRIYIDRTKAIFAKNNPQLPVYDDKNKCFAFAEIRTKSSNGDDRFRLDKNDDMYKYSVSPVFGETDAARTLVHDLITTYGKDSGVTVEIFITWKSDSLTEKRSYEYNIETVKSIIRSFSGNNYSLKFSASFKWANISDAKTASISTIVRSSTGVEIKSDAIDIVVE